MGRATRCFLAKCASGNGWTSGENGFSIDHNAKVNFLGPYLEFLRTPGGKTVGKRAHLDLVPYRGDGQAAEVARLKTLGATLADVGQGDVPWVVLADPEGNEFCVLAPG